MNKNCLLFQCGYFEKRTGKRWIENDKDLDAMYRSFNENDEITIWCEGKPGDDGVKKTGKKRKSDESECVEDRGNTGSSKRAARETEINRITQELRDMHGLDKWTLPQYRLWARMKVSGQHESLDHPPQIPLFVGAVKTPTKRGDNLTEALTSAATAVVGLVKGSPSTPTHSSPSTPTPTTALSPGKRAQVSGQYLEQLVKLKNLHELGILSLEEFNEQRSLL